MIHNKWDAGIKLPSPEDIELRNIKSYIRHRYDENKEFIPIEEVFEIIMSMNKHYREENKYLHKQLDDVLKYSIRPIIFEGSICPPLDKK